MKHLIASLLIALTAIFSSVDASAASNRFFKELSTLQGVESTYIGPAALRFVSAAISDYANLSNDLDADIKELKCIETLECDNKDSIKKIKSFVNQLVDRLSLEVMVESNDEEETNLIYCQPKEGEPGVIEAILIEKIEPEEINLVYMQGQFIINSVE